MLKPPEVNSKIDQTINVESSKGDSDDDIDSSLHVHKLANQIKAQLHSDCVLSDDLPLRQIGSSNSKFSTKCIRSLDISTFSKTSRKSSVDLDRNHQN